MVACCHRQLSTGSENFDTDARKSLHTVLKKQSSGACQCSWRRERLRPPAATGDGSDDAACVERIPARVTRILS